MKDNLYIPAIIIALALTVFLLHFEVNVTYEEKLQQEQVFEILPFQSRPKPKPRKRPAPSRNMPTTEVEPNPVTDQTLVPDPNQVDTPMDLSFYPEAIPPRLLGSLKRIYPPMAKAEEVEAMVIIDLFINKDGTIKSLSIVNITLSKRFPDQKEKNIEKVFSQATRQIFQDVRYTRPKVNDKNVPIRMEQSLRFSLKNS